MVTEYTAIIIEPVPGEKPKAYKYRHNIRESYIEKFCNDMRKRYPNATHINFYHKATRRFYGQAKLRVSAV